MSSLHHHNLTVGSFISSPHHNDTKVANTNEMNLVINIIWIILLCGIMASCAVFQAARCVMKRRRPYEVSTRTSEVSGGLKKSVVGKISTRVLGSEVKIYVRECSICLEDFVDGQNVRVLPHCGHEFHVRCVDKWFESHSSCPNCRNCLLEQPATSVVAIPQSVAHEDMV
ncbi:hypothetical protein SSX86_025956 [Deinandra increscens subsp. villosa]|uniref:RING-type E3 ubiquitin transferase n=1 Tax=Deinandra increscens subsp. villosa TaxID=3103831 RepID=A0AAP0CJJ1_9ASTR